MGERAMKVLKGFCITVVVLLAATSTAWASRNQCTGGSDNATWAATSNNSISLAAGSGAGGLGVNMTSPTCLNSYSTFPGTLAVYTDVALDSSTCPDGTSGSGATCPLTAPVASISNNPQDYSAFGQAQTYNVNFEATNATPGTYTFQVHANGSDPDNTGLNHDQAGSYGWGYGSGVELTVFVTTQNSCDPNDVLHVSFTEPQAGSVTFCTNGTDIPVNVTAGDTNNLITSMSVSVNNSDITGALSVTGLGTNAATAAGNYTSGKVGAYLFKANAATACTTGSAGPVEVDLVYAISALQGPLANGQKPKKGNKVPIQLTPLDCTGNPPAYDSSVHVIVYDSSNNLLQDATPGSCTGSSCGSGNSSYVTYTATSGQYQSVFQTGSVAGIYSVQIWFGGVPNFSTTFTTQ
jgi:hypothetical protein